MVYATPVQEAQSLYFHSFQVTRVMNKRSFAGAVTNLFGRFDFRSIVSSKTDFEL